MKFDPALVIWPFTAYLFRPTCDYINMVPLLFFSSQKLNHK